MHCFLLLFILDGVFPKISQKFLKNFNNTCSGFSAPIPLIKFCVSLFGCFYDEIVVNNRLNENNGDNSQNSMRPPQLSLAPRKLLHPQSHNGSGQWTSRPFARLYSHYAESGSLALCATHFLLLPSNPAVTSSTLSSWIDLPLDRATSASFNRQGVSVTLGKQKAGVIYITPAFLLTIKFFPPTF